ncbi:MAG: hypothetical protein R2716_11655 [Microthrixaceae bacterium]
MMGADTTKVSSRSWLVKHKKLVGGGTIEIVNQTVPRAALRRLGYDDSQVAEIVAHVANTTASSGAPHLEASTLSVFACVRRRPRIPAR